MPTKFKVHRQPQKVRGYVENIDGVPLEMILIPSGSFMMGTPDDEIERLCKEYERDWMRAESPIHEVHVPLFFMGRYPITQEQWKAIASRKDLQVGKDLTPDPSRFKGDKRPVERVSWYDAIEYCARLSKLTGRNYRLPSEAEWEYGCRALTSTPFHFGETISTDIANYRGTDDEGLNLSGSYGRGEKGVYREETTNVDQFNVGNGFGLSEMHGNVWEWCLDPWHDSYKDAPDDGSVWDEEHNDNYYQNLLININILFNGERLRVTRGGSWYYIPVDCRSAFRNDVYPDFGRLQLSRVACCLWCQDVTLLPLLPLLPFRRFGILYSTY